MNNEQTPRLETATLGGGCFWCLEAVYEEMNGVEKVESGYAGGSTAHKNGDEAAASSRQR